jgi:ATP-dependent DNA helicase DinG
VIDPFAEDGPPGNLSDLVAAVFEADGALARTLPGFEAREGQRDMAAAVAGAFEGGVLLAEAGTGTGKTLAYLVPAILSRQRVLISTGTKNLQEQILQKDLPLLQQTLDVPFTATCMKGRANYLCLHRFQALREGRLPRQSMLDGLHTGARQIDERVLLPLLVRWAARTETGDRAELDELPEELPLWKEISATSEQCLGTTCPQYRECFVTRMRQRAAESDVVIVNHHLLFADAAVRQGDFGEVIPSCAYAVLDEAHQLEDVATQYFGIAVSGYRIDDLMRDADRVATDWPDALRREALGAGVERVRDRSRQFFACLEPGRRTPDERVRVTADALADVHDGGVALGAALDALETQILLMKELPAAGASAAPPHVLNDLLSVAARAGALGDELRFLLKASDPDYVFFLESRGRSIALRAAPIDVSRIVREQVIERHRTTVLTSATLTVDGGFDYVRSRLGIGKAVEIRLPSEFDYRQQAILYLPKGMPSPKAHGFAEAAAREVVEILRRTSGRAFVLFTSYAMLRSVQPLVEAAVDYPVLVQGTAPRSALIETFRSTPSAVLLATSSFWQGVDVVGEALSCVIIDKLPFASPGDPVTAARLEALAARGGDPFADYQVPLAILALQQGLGRLIRSRRDRGVLAILDPRLRTMGYGRRFLASLPPAPVTFDLKAIEGFFGS